MTISYCGPRRVILGASNVSAIRIVCYRSSNFPPYLDGGVGIKLSLVSDSRVLCFLISQTFPK
jgi:hypothetical protein